MFRSLSFSLASVNHAAFLSLLEEMPLLPYPVGGGCGDLAGVQRYVVSFAPVWELIDL